jgi:hypothetical protein
MNRLAAPVLLAQGLLKAVRDKKRLLDLIS